jgi:hypothetical protein
MGAIKAGGASYKLRSAAGAMTEVAIYLNEIGGDVETDEFDGTTFQPGVVTPVKYKLYGAIERTHALTGRWVPAAETFFSGIGGLTDVPYIFGPEGTALGKMRMFGACNVGGWSGPSGSVDGLWSFSIDLTLTSYTAETITTPPAAASITASAIGDPTVITTSAAHGLLSGAVVVIAGHTGSTPAINGAHVVTVLTTTTFSIPIAVTVGGTGGTAQRQ